MSTLTLDLGRFVADLSWHQIPSEGCNIARTGIADCFGVLVAGSRDREIDLVDRELGNTVSVQRSLRSYPRVLGAASKPPVVTLDQIEHRID